VVVFGVGSGGGMDEWEVALAMDFAKEVIAEVDI